MSGFLMRSGESIQILLDREGENMKPRHTTYRTFASLPLAALALGLFLVFAPNQAAAQCPRVAPEVERTEEALQEIRERLRQHATDLSSASFERAKSLLTIAFKLQEEAKRMLQANECPTAMEFTMEARKKARAALGSLTLTDESESSLERLLVRTDELLGRLRELLPPDAPQPARAHLRRAHEIQRKAWETFRSGHPRMAAKLTREAQNIAHKLQQELRSEDRAAERFADNAERLQAALRRLTEGESDCNNEGRELIARAQTALQEALELQSEGHLRQAQTALRLANELGQKARAVCGAEGRLENEVARLSALAEKLSEEAQDNQEAKALIDTALRNISEAQNLLDQGLTRAASGQLKAAGLLLRQAEKLLRG